MGISTLRQRRDQQSRKKLKCVANGVRWGDPRRTLPREWSPREEAAHYVIPTIWHLGQGKSTERVKRLDCQGSGGMSEQSTEDVWSSENCSLWSHNRGYILLYIRAHELQQIHHCISGCWGRLAPVGTESIWALSVFFLWFLS